MNVRDIMCSPVHTCHASDSLDSAARIMWEHDCGSVPVVDEERCVVGVITDRDICMAAWTQGLSLAEIPVKTAMSQEVHACSMLAALDAVQSLMREHRVRRVPIVDDGQRVVGIVSINDIALAARDGLDQAHAPVSAEEVVVLLGSVSEPRTERQGAASAGEGTGSAEAASGAAERSRHAARAGDSRSAAAAGAGTGSGFGTPRSSGTSRPAGAPGAAGSAGGARAAGASGSSSQQASRGRKTP